MPILWLIIMPFEQLFYKPKMLYEKQEPVVDFDNEEVVLYDTDWCIAKSRENAVMYSPKDKQQKLFDWDPEAADRVVSWNDPIQNDRLPPIEENSIEMDKYFESMFLGEQNVTEQSLPFPDLNDIFGEVNIFPEETNKGNCFIYPEDQGFKVSSLRRSNRKSKQTVCYLCDEIHN